VGAGGAAGLGGAAGACDCWGWPIPGKPPEPGACCGMNCCGGLKWAAGAALGEVWGMNWGV